MFSDDSRWDRHLPDQSYEEEKIEVGAVFKDGRLYPRWFLWRDRRYKVEEITYQWQDKRGGQILHYFTVSDGANVYQIYFNNHYLHWRLSGISSTQTFS